MLHRKYPPSWEVQRIRVDCGNLVGERLFEHNPIYYTVPFRSDFNLKTVNRLRCRKSSRTDKSLSQVECLFVSPVLKAQCVSSYEAYISIKTWIMSTTSLDKELQERLREASAIGDIEEVKTLVESGVNINSQNEINGWCVLTLSPQPALGVVFKVYTLIWVFS